MRPLSCGNAHKNIFFTSVHAAHAGNGPFPVSRGAATAAAAAVRARPTRLTRSPRSRARSVCYARRARANLGISYTDDVGNVLYNVRVHIRVLRYVALH